MAEITIQEIIEAAVKELKLIDITIAAQKEGDFSFHPKGDFYEPHELFGRQRIVWSTLARRSWEDRDNAKTIAGNRYLAGKILSLAQSEDQSAQEAAFSMLNTLCESGGGEQLMKHSASEEFPSSADQVAFLAQAEDIPQAKAMAKKLSAYIPSGDRDTKKKTVRRTPKIQGRLAVK